MPHFFVLHACFVEWSLAIVCGVSSTAWSHAIVCGVGWCHVIIKVLPHDPTWSYLTLVQRVGWCVFYHNPTRSSLASVHRVGSCVFYRMIPRDRIWRQFIARDHACFTAWSYVIVFDVSSARGSCVFYHMIPRDRLWRQSSRGIMRVLPHDPTRSYLALVHRVGPCVFYLLIPRDRLWR